MILFAAKDAGPAAYISEIIKALGEGYLCLSSDVSAKIFDHNGIKNRRVSFEGQDQYDDYIHSGFINEKIDLIITGASGGVSIDKALIRFGTENGIKVISIIEHWSWYRERFEVGNQLRLPDYIFVNDETAKKEAVESGLPPKKILALGNPVLEQRLHDKAPVISRKAWGQELNIPDKKIITFISECYSTDFPLGSRQFQGFDEFCVLEDILGIWDKQYHLVLKLHPQEKADKYDSYKNEHISVFSNLDIPSLRTHSDFIIGLGSMLLLEMAIQRRDIISYRPHDRKSFIGNTIGATTLVKNKEQLKDILEGKSIINNFNVMEIFDGSTQRVINFIKSQI